MERSAALSVLVERLPGDAETLLPTLVDDAVVGGYARAWLVSTGRADESSAPDAEQRRWLALDSLAGLLETVGDQLSPRDLPDEVWQLVDEEVDLGTVWQVQHPQLLEVLEVVGRGHPRGRERKAAKKAAFKARKAAADSAGAVPPAGGDPAPVR